MSNGTPPPPDQHHRDRASRSIGETIFVEAGAGSGKTRTLVDRVLCLVDSGVDVRSVAAITFTEAAAAELRDRVRRALRDTLDESPDARVRSLRQAAVDDVDSAAIGTLHGFARRLLAEHPIEAGLPVTFTVRDEITSQVAMRALWAERATALMMVPELADELAIASAARVAPGRLRELAQSLDRSWDRIDDAMLADLGPLDATRARDEVAAAIESLLEHTDDCAADDDTLLAEIHSIQVYGERLRSAQSAARIVAVLGAGKPSLKVGNKGRSGNWHDVKAARARVDAVRDLREQHRQVLVERAVRRVITVLAREVLAEAQRRQRSGEVTYDDLLVLARRLLSTGPAAAAVRHALHERFTHVLIDEFQDTDPVQVDLAMRLTADPADARELDELAPRAGRLFTVGDPKQSIYRFRGADLAMYLDVSSRLAVADGALGARVPLTTNFRSVEPIIAWVNQTFMQVIQVREGSQPAYEALASFRGIPGLSGPPVVQLGAEPHDNSTKVAAMREAEAEAADIASVVLACIGNAEREPWQVASEQRVAGAAGNGNGSAASARPALLKDISILLPYRTALPVIVDALDRAGIPYRTESSGLVYSSPEVRALMAALCVIDEPSNELALVSALRSPLFGCGDDDLYRYRCGHGGAWNMHAPVPAGMPGGDPVAESVRYLRSLSGLRHSATPAQLLERITRDCRTFELAYVDDRPRDLWRRVRFVIDQARAWSDAGGGSLRDYLGWIRLQTEANVRVQEAILPEHDDDAVRLLTVHASKGLEFPVVIVAGLTNVKPKGERTAFVRWTGGSAGSGDGGSNGAAGTGYDFWASGSARSTGIIESEDDDRQRVTDELRRLMYVACTRARDHLVVSTHRRYKANGDPEADLAWTIAIACEQAGAEQWKSDGTETFVGVTPHQPAAVLPPYDEWLAGLEQARALTRVPHAIAARAFGRLEGASDTAGAADTAAAEPGGVATSTAPTGDIDDDAVPVQRGRGSTAVGRAVHGVLQTVDMGDGHDLAEFARLHCHLEHLAGRETEVAGLAKLALASGTVRQAAAARHWRELHVCGELDGQLVEGVIDLVYEADSDVVIVDYKTDDVHESTFAAHADAYRAQVRTYARLLAQVLGRPIAKGILLHLQGTTCTAHDVPLGMRPDRVNAHPA